MLKYLVAASVSLLAFLILTLLGWFIAYFAFAFVVGFLPLGQKTAEWTAAILAGLSCLPLTAGLTAHLFMQALSFEREARSEAHVRDGGIADVDDPVVAPGQHRR